MLAQNSWSKDISGIWPDVEYSICLGYKDNYLHFPVPEVVPGNERLVFVFLAAGHLVNMEQYIIYLRLKNGTKIHLEQRVKLKSVRREQFRKLGIKKYTELALPEITTKEAFNAFYSDLKRYNIPKKKRVVISNLVRPVCLKHERDRYLAYLIVKMGSGVEVAKASLNEAIAMDYASKDIDALMKEAMFRMTHNEYEKFLNSD